MIRALIIIVALVIIMGLVGWLQFSSTDGDPTIRVNTEKVKQDSSRILEQSKKALE